MVLNLILVIQFEMGVVGVAIATVISQCISCVLVLRCLYYSEGSYQLRFAKLGMKARYVKQIFQVGIPAGIQSTIINFSNVLLQSSVNSFGSIAMAGYTAANNILGFLYMSVNSITQACMSFTSQNYGVRKLKRMDKVLLECLGLTVTISLIFGGGSYLFGRHLMHIYTNSPDVVACGMDIMLYTTVTYFLCGIMDLIPGDGTFNRANDPLGDRNGWNKSGVDLSCISVSQGVRFFVHILSGIVDSYDRHAGDLLLFCEEKGSCVTVRICKMIYVRK